MEQEYGTSSDLSTNNGMGGEQMSREKSVLQIINDLSTPVWAFSALASALEAGLLESLTSSQSLLELSRKSGIPVSLVEGLLDVLVALGLLQREEDVYSCTSNFLPFLQAPARDSLLATVRTVYLQSRQIIEDAKSRKLATGWSYTDPEILLAQGLAGAPTFPGVGQVILRLDGMAERFQRPTATFLDVGTGVAAFAIGICQLFPTLHVVGLEPQAAPMAEARRRVAAAGLEERIELRAQRIEDLTEREAFDLVWIPQMFLPRAVLERGLRTAWTALRPGGWIALPLFSTPGKDLPAALGRLRNIQFGGDPLYQEQLAELLTTANFTHVQIVTVAPGNTGIVGRKEQAQRVLKGGSW